MTSLPCLALLSAISCLSLWEEVVEHNFLPLPLGEVAERSEDGEGKSEPLSVAFGDSSPGGRAKPPLRHADSGPQGFLRAAANTNEKRNLETGVIRVLCISGR